MAEASENPQSLINVWNKRQKYEVERTKMATADYTIGGNKELRQKEMLFTATSAHAFAVLSMLMLVRRGNEVGGRVMGS